MQGEVRCVKREISYFPLGIIGRVINRDLVYLSQTSSIVQNGRCCIVNTEKDKENSNCAWMLEYMFINQGRVPCNV